MVCRAYTVFCYLIFNVIISQGARGRSVNGSDWGLGDNVDVIATGCVDVGFLICTETASGVGLNNRAM